jgi:uncharacterized membrane protein
MQLTAMFELPQAKAPQKRSFLRSLGLAFVLLGLCFFFFAYSYHLMGVLFYVAGGTLAVADRRQEKNPQLTHLFPQ